MDRGEKLLLFGGSPTGYLCEWEITSGLNVTGRTLGLCSAAVPMAELRGMHASLSPPDESEAARLARDRIMRASREPQVAGEEEEKAMTIYPAMAGIVQNHCLSACGDHRAALVERAEEKDIEVVIL